MVNEHGWQKVDYVEMRFQSSKARQMTDSACHGSIVRDVAV